MTTPDPDVPAAATSAPAPASMPAFAPAGSDAALGPASAPALSAATSAPAAGTATSAPAPVLKDPVIHVDGWLMPRASSTVAHDVDTAWNVVLVMSAFFFVLMMGLVTYFGIRYRRRSDRDITSDVDHNGKLEALWTIVPLGLLVVLFLVGFKGYLNAAIPPANAFEIQVTAQKWSWTFTYPNGYITTRDEGLVVPAWKPVRLVMSSQDVIHSFYIPEFRIKRDVMPGLYSTTWFEAKEPGETILDCAEYCGGAGVGTQGSGHSGMWARVTIMPPDQFDLWLKDKEMEMNAALPPVELGRKLYTGRQCSGCHSLDGTRGTGPSFKGLWGKTEAMSDGLQVHIDGTDGDNYLRESILQSRAKVVATFQPVMPVFEGQLNEKQVSALIAFIKAQK